ncbi:MAG: hypothetical protein D6715_00360, partial [Calditrichaeota bacterium]
PSNRIFLPPGVQPRFNDTLMVSIRRWLLRNGQGILSVYGGRDPWGSTGLIFPSGDPNNLSLVKPDGNHATRIGSFSEAEQTRARAFLRRWLGLAEQEPNHRASTGRAAGGGGR